MEALQQFSISLIQALQTLSPALDGLMNFFTFLGRAEFYLLIAPFIFWTIDKRLGMRALIILIATDVITSSFKLLFHQPRPYWIGGVRELSQESSYGIPSSHASDSLAVGGYLAYRTKRTWFRVAIGIILLFIGLSRLYLGVHFLHDVLFGWLIGASVLWVAIKQSKQIAAWARSKSLSAQIGIGFVLSGVIILLGILIRSLISGTPDPASWSSFATEARSITHSFTLAGAFFGAITGYALMRQNVHFRPAENWSKRVLSYIIGIIGLVLIYLGLDIAFSMIAADESILGYVLRYIRYALATFWVTLGAPWVFLKAKLAEPEI
ncbi:MAG: phosphatase PAP2 family protein [Anaerolineae bacterium]|nr:phosphatase PAP2 family protein [Anaerolineae bacterium]MCI0607491.1 phosphatase PAP2 family protein [Anaerolineae bacterium]